MKHSKALAILSLIALTWNSTTAFADEPRQMNPTQTSSVSKMPAEIPAATTLAISSVNGQNTMAQLIKSNPTASATTISSKTVNTSSTIASAPSTGAQSSGQSNGSSSANGQAATPPTTNTNQAPPAQAILTGGPDQSERSSTNAAGTLADPTRIVTYNGTSKTVKIGSADRTNSSPTTQTTTTREEINTYKWENRAWKLVSKSGFEDIRETWNNTIPVVGNLTQTTEGTSSEHWNLSWAINAAGQPSAQPTETLEYQSWDEEITLRDDGTGTYGAYEEHSEEHWTQQNEDENTRVGYKEEFSGDPIADNTTVTTTWDKGTEVKTTIRNTSRQNPNPPFTATISTSVEAITSKLGIQVSKTEQIRETEYTFVNGVEQQTGGRIIYRAYDENNSEISFRDHGWTTDLITHVSTYRLSEMTSPPNVSTVTVQMDSDTKELQYMEVISGGVRTIWRNGAAWTDDLLLWFRMTTGMFAPFFSPPSIT